MGDRTISRPSSGLLGLWQGFCVAMQSEFRGQQHQAQRVRLGGPSSQRHRRVSIARRLGGHASRGLTGELEVGRAVGKLLGLHVDDAIGPPTEWGR